MKTIYWTFRHVGSHKQIRVCVSSRPEQIFCRGFSLSPQIRLQDLNLPDLKRTTEESLHSVLNRNYPDQPYKIHDLIDATVRKSQGIFLWLHLMIKRIVRGVRNADTLDELALLLDDAPDSIYGLYEQMFAKIDRVYMREAFRYHQ